MTKRNLTSIPPREKSGRDTALRFEYQYRFAAEAALEILEGTGVVCVFCDYHDDYVTQKEDGTSHKYEFVQVKTNKKEKHEWDFSKVFGVSKGKKVLKDGPSKSFAGKLFYHQLSFDEQCLNVTLLTNVFVVDDLSTLIQECSKVDSYDKLTGESSEWFNKISSSFQADFKNDNLDNTIIFNFLKKFRLRTQAGDLVDEEQKHSALFLKKIYDFSEVELTQREGYKIYSDLIEKVREKSIASIEATITPDELKSKAGIVLDDLLSILSISKSGYEILKNGGDQKAIKTTTKLQKYLSSKGASTSMLDIACRAKVLWDNWIRQNRHVIGETDLGLLTIKCSTLIKEQNTMGRTIDQLLKEFETIAISFNGKINYQLNSDLVFGLYLSLIAKGEE